MKFIRSIQISDNVTDIMRLPCISGCKKLDDKNGFEWLEYQTRGCNSEIAEKGDWLCQDPNGDWHVLSDEEHRKEVNNERYY